MRKSPLIALLTISIIGGAYALVSGLYPDNGQFPRVPTNPGTIGGTIAKILGVTDLATYNGTGVVANTNALSGITATGFLKSQDICIAPNVWLRTDATGKPVCGSKNTTLASIGTVQKNTCTAKAYRADGTIANLDNGNNILEGDIIQTDPGCSLTITFADLSLIRLDGGSTVSLDIGTTISGQSIAYAILNNGGLWGRVLTETGGYYIGSSDIVAGVRGTSISYEREKWATNPSPQYTGTGWVFSKAMTQGEMKIIHSTKSGVTLECDNGTTKFVGTGSNIYLPTGGTGPGIDCSAIHPYTIPTLYDNYTNSGIARNTVADLNYMVKLLSRPELATKYPRINSEISVTKPKTPAQYDAICPDTMNAVGGGIQTVNVYWDSLSGSEMGPCQPDVIAFADLSSSSKLFFKNGKTLEARYEKASGEYYKTLKVWNQKFIGANFPNPAEKSEIATNTKVRDFFVANQTTINNEGAWVQGVYATGLLSLYDAYTNTWQYDQIWYLSGIIQSPTYTAGSSDGGMRIDDVGEYLTYPINSIGNLVGFSGGTLKNRTVTIELGTPIGSTMNCVANKCYVANFGSEMYFIQKDSMDCVNSTVPGKYAFCKKLGTSTATPYPSSTSNNVTGRTQIVFALSPTPPSQFLLGNNTIPGTLPLMNTIKKVSIQ